MAFGVAEPSSKIKIGVTKTTSKSFGDGLASQPHLVWSGFGYSILSKELPFFFFFFFFLIKKEINYQLSLFWTYA
jgi:hypothetical protein